MVLEKYLPLRRWLRIEAKLATPSTTSAEREVRVACRKINKRTREIRRRMSTYATRVGRAGLMYRA